MKFIRFLLFPIALVYDLVTTIRNLLYDYNIFKENKFEIPIIAVGNLSVGGTGKSPQIEYLIRLLKNDYRVATLSRGYKRKTEGFLLVNNKHSVEDVGDEPLQFYKKYGKEIKVAVDANRTNGINKLLRLPEKPEVILLDDAFQHRKVKAGFYILLTKFDDLFVDDFILPTGNLREGRRGAKRANMIIITKCPNNLSEDLKQTIIKKIKPLKHQQVYFTGILYEENINGKKEILVDKLKNKELLLITGIANPKPLLDFLTLKEIKFKHLPFPDHYNFTQADIEKIIKKYDAIKGNEKILLTTEKDFVRLENKIDNLYYLSIESVFLEKQNEFNSLINSYVNR
ncbi:tetraacyldisaccharide 4'-kinase [Tenacibaculum sp. 190524A02b]|uniref:tetraacyldisaccharide 4'-kinase n=1 Tax=Tenacibaculum vairaonense TaxID=3137860 RepID=UPI0031FAEED9